MFVITLLNRGISLG